MTDLTPKERAARIKLDFTIEPETEKRLREAIEREIDDHLSEYKSWCVRMGVPVMGVVDERHRAALRSGPIIPVAQRTERAGPNGDAAGSIPAGDAKPQNTDEHARAVILDGLADEYLRSSCSNEMARIAFYRLISVLAGCRVPPETKR